MYQKLFKFAATILTILTASLLSTFLTDLMVSYKWEYKPMRFSLFAMAVITLIFYPLFVKLEDILNSISRKFIKVGKSWTGRYLGLLLMFLLGLLILLYFYAHMWYQINIFKSIWEGNFLKMF